jgi:hypothetical protein
MFWGALIAVLILAHLGAWLLASAAKLADDLSDSEAERDSFTIPTPPFVGSAAANERIGRGAPSLITSHETGDIA